MKIPSRFLPVTAMILVAALFRLMPYILGAFGMGNVREATTFVWTLSPIAALFLFGGAQFAERRWAYLAPLAAMVVSDLGIGLLMGDVRMGLYPLIPVIYGSYAVIIWLGTRLRERRSGVAIAVSALSGEVLFFVITNFAHWAVQTDTYPHTFAGLIECYLVGIPFFRKLVINMAIYTPMLFGGWALIERRIMADKTELAPQ
jgi:hypothetical protein